MKCFLVCFDRIQVVSLVEYSQVLIIPLFRPESKMLQMFKRVIFKKYCVIIYTNYTN